MAVVVQAMARVCAGLSMRHIERSCAAQFRVVTSGLRLPPPMAGAGSGGGGDQLLRRSPFRPPDRPSTDPRSSPCWSGPASAAGGLSVLAPPPSFGAAAVPVGGAAGAGAADAWAAVRRSPRLGPAAPGAAAADRGPSPLGGPSIFSPPHQAEAGAAPQQPATRSPPGPRRGRSKEKTDKLDDDDIERMLGGPLGLPL